MKMVSFNKLILATFFLLNVGCYGLKKPVNEIKTLISSSTKDLTMINLPEELTDKQKEVVFKYAPVFFQETNKKANPEHWDFITSFDFDGDLQGNNNEESIKANKHPLPATVYYSLLETETHYFITYSSFHPLDWDTAPAFIPFTWHENDMENIQVVVRKADGKLSERVILLSAQAHLDTEISTISDSGISSNNIKISTQNFRPLTESLEDNGTHCGLFVESGGHGIYSMTSKKSKFSNLHQPTLHEGFTFIPTKNEIPDIYSDSNKIYHYQLKSTYNSFWTDYKNNIHIGDGKLMDGKFSYKDEIGNYPNLPRHFDSDRLSGPGKRDSGILPFAFSYSLNSNDLGSIFFNPAKKYNETLKIKGKWSKNYTYNPYMNPTFNPVSLVRDGK